MPMIRRLTAAIAAALMSIPLATHLAAADTSPVRYCRDVDIRGWYYFTYSPSGFSARWRAFRVYSVTGTRKIATVTISIDGTAVSGTVVNDDAARISLDHARHTPTTASALIVYSFAGIAQTCRLNHTAA